VAKKASDSRVANWGAHRELGAEAFKKKIWGAGVRFIILGKVDSGNSRGVQEDVGHWKMGQRP